MDGSTRASSTFHGIPEHPAGLGSSQIELRVQAIGFAARGWSVVPGTYPEGDRWTGHHDEGPVPVHPDWRTRPTATPDQVVSWWSERPYSLLVATGGAVEAIEVDAELGRRTARVIRMVGAPVPIVATPRGRWYFLHSGGRTMLPELADVPGIRWHSTGSWLPMPPSAFPGGAVHWRVGLDVCGWRLPSSAYVQDALRAGRGNYENVAEVVAAAR